MSILKGRREATSILELRDGPGMATAPEDLCRVTNDFYTSLYASELTQKDDQDYFLSLLDKADEHFDDNICQCLMAPITATELNKVLKAAPAGKSPGPNGISAELYKKLAPLLESDFVALLNKFLTTEEMEPVFKEGIISLIFKKGNQAEIKNYRLILLLCSDYKILTKILTDCIVSILSKIIGVEQTGFLSGWQITDNVIFAQLIQEYCKLQHINAILVFLDQEKAYDRVKHSFLAAVLKKMGFPLRFVRWILMLYKDAASQVLVNGHLFPAFSIGCGVCQGDPLSCLLFICMIEVLSLALKKELPGLQLPGNTTATHSMYADDTMAILNGTRELSTLQKILDRYRRASGACINFTKSKMLPLGMLNPDRGIPTDIP